MNTSALYKDVKVRPQPISPFRPCVHENEPFREHSSNRRYLKTLALRFRLPIRVLLKHTFKMSGDCCVFKFLRRSVDGA